MHKKMKSMAISVGTMTALEKGEVDYLSILAETEDARSLRVECSLREGVQQEWEEAYASALEKLLNQSFGWE